ncbi:TetR/AcrR family transcriptional regulator [Nocardia sp. alder85J]|uniref:TetR/AcrR family transcriptional regulator n=1 Tax=Nocardia sp. alder85J TaxID=2862949 RepID=UPI001CD2CA4B|nr:TetR/AcrR family transcriptional regulator [Nocardia sp. alder85J]MCX4092911.1 TetR/AcrR family transcriptional regulator [Nocardia sp. alder85J]
MAAQPPLGLREQKKLDTRMALSDAALMLMFEHGLDNVVREDIAARAGVSVRTFTNYFANKYEAIAYRQIERMRRTIALLGARPAGEPLWEAVTAAVLLPLEDDGIGLHPPTREQLAEAGKLGGIPEVSAAFIREVAGELLAAVAARTGTDPDHDVYPHLVAGAVVVAYQAAIEVYVHADPPVLLTVPLREAFARIAAGLPDPSA